MNREQRRAAGKGQDSQRIEVTGIVAHFQNGQYVNLDTSKVTIVDKDTMRPVFEEVLQPVPKQVGSNEELSADDYVVKFDTPEGPMEYVKRGNWSGVRKANN